MLNIRERCCISEKQDEYMRDHSEYMREHSNYICENHGDICENKVNI